MIGLPRVMEVKLFEGTKEEVIVKVKKLPLGKAVQLSSALKGLPEKIKELSKNPELQQAFKDNKDMETMEFASLLIGQLPAILEVATDSVIEILAIGSGLDKIILEEKCGLDEASELLLAILTVNNIKAVWGNAKKIQQLLSPKKLEDQNPEK